MPQSTKDSNGGKTHGGKNNQARGQTGNAKQDKKKEATSDRSPVGSPKHGEKKTTN